MAKIILNNKEYTISDSALATAIAELRTHLSTNMSGSGATINFGGTAYSIDSTKLSTATNNFVSHLGTIAGDGAKVKVGNIEYSVDATKISGSMSELEDAFGELESVDLGYYTEPNEFGGETLYITDPNTVLTLVDNEFGGQTAIIN